MASRRDLAAAPAMSDDIPGRILRTAADLLFAQGYGAFTMDALAHELGMSKKTIYVHFPSKDDVIIGIVDAIGEGVRAQTEAVFADAGLDLTQKLERILLVVSETMGRAQSNLLRDLQRHAPRVFRKIEELRATNIPLVIGRILRMGVAEGLVRPDIDLDFATRYWIQVINGLSEPATLQQTGLSPRETFDKSIRLFLGGVFTDAGRRSFGAAPAGRKPRSR